MNELNDYFLLSIDPSSSPEQDTLKLLLCAQHSIFTKEKKITRNNYTLNTDHDYVGRDRLSL